MARRRPRYSGTHPRRFEERYKEHAPARHAAHTAHLRAKGRTPASTHVPVLLQEVLEHLAPRPGGVLVDCTLGYGGHARALLERITATDDAALLVRARLIGLDVDGVELPRTVERLRADFGEALRPRRMRFAGIAKALALEGIASVDGILADLGVSSMQLDDPARGFSAKHDGPLDLRMDDRLARTGADLVNSMGEAELAAALRELADEPDAEAIARAIVERRSARPLARTVELAKLVLEAKGLPRGGARRALPDSRRARAVHPAARTFQALRMRVNDEPGNLRELLRIAPGLLAPSGRFVVVSFHRGEDRLVKESFRAGLAAGLYSSVASAPIRPSREELRANPRASPARLRFAVRAAPSRGPVA